MKDAREWIMEYETDPDAVITPDWVRQIQQDALESASAECDHAIMNAKTCGDDFRVTGWLDAVRDDILNLLTAAPTHPSADR